MKADAASQKFEVTRLAQGLFKVKINQGRGFFKIGVEKKPGEANSYFLEINGSRKFEVGNDCDTCHFWFKCLHEPRLSRKVVNLPKAFQVPRPIDEAMVQELAPILDLQEKGEYDIFETSFGLTGPYDSEDEGSYFFNSEFMDLWDIADPREEGLLSGWEHYEGQRPRVFRHSEAGVMESQFNFVIPLVPRDLLKADNIKVYQSMIANGDRPRVLLLGLYHRGIPEVVRRGRSKVLHSFFAGFVLDGHHKLAAYRRAGVPAKFLVVLSQKASKYFLLREEGVVPKPKFEERLTALSAE
ncbi:MAG: hypothetical protein PHF00_01415 [Elusimicrobia bacterium]|nr:hypothetical protein [Elusimicrobiota bacterium]